MRVSYSVIITLSIAITLGSCGPSDPSEDTEFLKAVRQNKTEKISELLSQDPALLSQKTDNEGLTALHIAAQKSKGDILELLLEKGAKPDERSKNGNTALHYAMDNFHNAFAVARVLLEAGIDPSIQNEAGETAWDLIDNERAKTRFTKKENELLALLLKYDFVPDTSPGENQKTLLHRMAEKAEDPDIIRLLIEKHRLDPGAVDSFGWTPLHYAVQGQHKEIARVLIDNGADINSRSTQNRDEIKGGADEDIRYKYPVGSTPKDVYRQQSTRGRESLVKFFDKYGAKTGKEMGEPDSN